MAENGMVEEAMDVEPLSPLLQLPLEIVDHIATVYLLPADYKSLRLTARFFGAAMTRLLYRRVYMSKTKLDRDKFFNIAQHPHLATDVRQLVWWELEESTHEPDEHGTYNIPDFEKLARDAIWLVSKGCTAGYLDSHPKEAAKKAQVNSQFTEMEFLARFLSALDQMPGLETTERVISTEEYTLTARMFQNGCGWTSEEDAHHGFIKFLLPAMRRPNSTVKHLAVAEHDGDWFPGLLRPIDTLSFQKLTHIALALGRGKSSDLEDLGLCVRMATNLVELRLDMERGSLSGYLLLDAVEGKPGQLSFSALCYATSASLPPVSGHSWFASGCGQDPRFATQQHHNNGRRNDGFQYCVRVRIARILNGKGSLPFNPELDGSWNTTHTMFDPEATPTAALFEASREPSLYTEEDVRVILNNLHHTAPPLLRSEHSLYTREKRAKEMLRKGTDTRSSDPRRFISDTIPVSNWLFKHPDGSEAVGDEPLEFWSDWEDSFDDTSEDGDDREESVTDDGLVDATDEDAVMVDGLAHLPFRISGPVETTGINGEESVSNEGSDSDESSMSDGEGSVFDGDDLIDTMEAPVPVMERRFQAIPLWNDLSNPGH